MQNHFAFTTRRAADVAGVEQHVMRTSVQRHGHWLGIVPIRLPSGHLRWPSVKVYQALGRLPQGRTPATPHREHICSHRRTDPFQTQQVVDHLLDPAPQGGTIRDRLDYLASRTRFVLAQIEGQMSLVHHTLLDEQLLTDADWLSLNRLADEVLNATQNLCRPLRWRSGK